MTPTILALDQSTSATKAVLFDLQGHVLDKAVRSHQQIYPKPSWVEHDAEQIWQNTLAVIKEVADRNSTHLEQLACLSITNQRETVVVFDTATGRPLHNALVWQDRRGDSICQKLIADGWQELVQLKTGLKIDSYFSASKLKWLINENPNLAAKLKTGSARIGTIDTYLVYRLTAGSVFATEHTNASRTLLFDIGKLRWDEELCALFDVPVNALPEVRESAALFGYTDAHGALPKPVPIIGVMGDSQASLFAQRCYTPGMAKATFGTGTSVLLNIGSEMPARLTTAQPGISAVPQLTEPTSIAQEDTHLKSSAPLSEITGTTTTTQKQGAVTALAWVWRGNPTYALEGIINFSAATIEWLKNQLELIHDVSQVEQLATCVSDNAGVYLVPAFAGLSAPYWSPNARAAIIGMTAHTRREHVVRAALEAIAYQIRDVLDMMQAEAGLAVQCLHADGGPTRNKFLMQFTADITRLELRVSDVAESSAWGAAMSGLLGLEFCKSLDDLAALPRSVQIYRPQMPAAVADQFHKGWLDAVRRVL